MKNSKSKCDEIKKCTIFDSHFWLVCFISVGSMLGIAMLSASIFSPSLLLVLTLGVCLTISLCAGLKLSPPKFRWQSLFAFAILIAVFLRSDVYPHMMGGQDQGLYTNYAELMLQTGGVNFIDNFRIGLPESLKGLYDKVAMASVPLIDSEKSVMTIVFYPLHPMWMAIFSWFLGEENKTLSLLFFSLIYIWTGKILAEEIFESVRAGNIAAFLLAINPVLAFFSKYPVTEMVGLAFSFNGFLYLIRGIKCCYPKQKCFYLVLSLLCFSSFFFVRMQFLMYLPFFLLLALGFFLHDRVAHWSAGVIPILIIACILFGASLVWYYIFQNALFVAMIGGHVLERVSNLVVAPRYLGLLIAVIFLLLVVVCYRTYFSQSFTVRDAIPWLLSKSALWLSLAFLASIISVIDIYKTGAISPFPWVFDTSDSLLFRYHAIYRFMLFISPFAFLTLIFGSYNVTFKKVLPSLLLLFIAVSWLVVLVQPWIPYLYYYGRYLAGEVLPYSLIAVAGVFSIWIQQNRRCLAYPLMSLTCLYYLVFYMPQFRSIESEPPDAYSEFSATIRNSDIVLAVGLDDRILVPLRLAHGKNIFAIKKWDTSEKFITETLFKLRDHASENGGRLLLLKAEGSYHIGSFLGGATFYNSFITNGEHIREGVMQSLQGLGKMFLPFVTMKKSSRWMFHDISMIDFNTLPHGGLCMENIDFSEGGNLEMSGIKLEGFSHQEKRGRWTDGGASVLECIASGNYQMATFKVTPYIPREGFTQNVVVSINGRVLDQVELNMDVELVNIKIPPDLDLEPDGRLRVVFNIANPVSPVEVGESSDSRKLGIYVYSASFK